MTDSATARKKKLLLEIAIALSLLVAALVLARFGRTKFQELVRATLIAKLQTITGGRVEMKDFRFDVGRLQLESDDLTLHGLEATGQPPYVHIDRLMIRLKVLSFFGGKLGLRDLVADRPVVHITTDSNGATNLPRPVLVQSQASIENLFEAGIEHLEVTRGELFWNDQHIPLDLVADGVTAGLNYVPASKHFNGALDIARLETRLWQWRPMASSFHVKFIQERNRAQIQGLNWTSQGSTFQATGTFDTGASPQLSLAYNSTLDLSQLAQVARSKLLQGGTLHLAGSATARLHEIQARGNADLSNAGFSTGTINLANFAARAAFELNNRELDLSQLSGTWASGRFRGSGKIRDWCFAPVCEYLATSVASSTGRAEVEFSNFNIQDVVAAGLNRHSALTALKPSGTASGAAALNWRGAFRDLQTKLQAVLQFPAGAAAGSLPLQGTLNGSYDSSDHVLQVISAQLKTPASTVNVNGDLGRASSKLNLDIQSRDLAEFTPAITALNLPQIPGGLRGAGSFKGAVLGFMTEPAFIGRIAASPLAFDLRSTTALPMISSGKKAAVAAAPVRPLMHVSLDHLFADIELSRSNLNVRNGDAAAGASQVLFSGSTTLLNYSVAPQAKLLADVSAVNAPLSDAQRLAGRHYPISGNVTFHSHISGTVADPDVSGNFKIVDGSAFWLPFKSFAGALSLANHEVRVADGVMNLGNASLSGSGSYSQLTQTFGFTMQGGEFDLGKILALQRPHFSVEGKANFHAQGSGTLSAPRINAALNLSQMVLNGESAGDLTLEAATQGPDLHVRARTSLSSAQVALAGTVLLRGDWPAQLNLDFSGLDIDPLLRAYVQGRVTEHSSVDGHVSLQGPLLRPAELSMIGEITRAIVNVENVKLQSEGPLKFALSSGILNLERAHIVGEGTDFSASGSIAFAEISTMNMRADGRVNLRVLQSFNPDVISSGVTTVAMRVEGTLRHPAVSGRLQVQNAAFTYRDLATGLNEVNGSMVFNENRLQVESLTARAGGGDLNLAGFVAYSHGIYFDLLAKGNAIRLRYPPGVSAIGDAALRYQGTLKSSLLSGDVTITKFGINPQFDFAQYLARSTRVSTGPKPDSILNTIHFDVHLVTASELQVETAMARITGDADFRLRGIAARPVVLGRVNIGDGEVVFNGTKYHLERGDILFINPVTIQPVLDVEASARVRDVDITLGFHGPTDKMGVTYRSDPPLPSSDIIALIALGRTRQDTVLNTRQTQTPLEVSSSNLLLGQALNAAMTSRVQRLFGVSHIKIDPQAGGPENNPNARLTVEQQVSNNVTLTYITNLSQSAQQVIQMEVQINRSVSLIAIRDENGVVGFDIHLRQRKR